MLAVIRLKGHAWPLLRVRITVFEILTTLLNLYSFVKDLYRNRATLLRIASSLLRGVRWISIKSLGVTASFFGGGMVCATPFAVWQYFHTPGMFAPNTLIPSIIGVFLGTEIFLMIGGYLFGLGVCALAPKSRSAKYFRTHFLKRNEKKRSLASYPARSVFGLFLRNVAPKP